MDAITVDLVVWNRTLQNRLSQVNAVRAHPFSPRVWGVAHFGPPSSSLSPPQRHIPVNQESKMAQPYIISSLSPTRGFHPTSSSALYFAGSSSQTIADAYASCHIYIYYQLPPLLFIDVHELAQRSELYGYTYWGTRDLEKPAYALPPAERSGEVLIRVKVPEQLWEHRIPGGNWKWEDETEVGKGGGWIVSVDVPMHLRYGSPRSTKNSGELYEEIHVDWPHAFLHCPSSSLSIHQAYMVLVKFNERLSFYSPAEAPAYTSTGDTTSARFRRITN